MNIFENYDAFDCPWTGCKQESKLTHKVKWGAFVFLCPVQFSGGHNLILCRDTVVVYDFNYVIEYCCHYWGLWHYCAERIIYMSVLNLSVTEIYNFKCPHRRNRRFAIPYLKTLFREQLERIFIIWVLVHSKFRIPRHNKYYVLWSHILILLIMNTVNRMKK